MKHSSKTRTWANDDEMVNPIAEPLPADKQPVEADHPNEESSHTQRKKVKVNESPQASKVVNRDVETDHDQTNVQAQPMTVDKSEGEEHPENAMEQDTSAAPLVQDEPVSDADWLRSKTSRLLGLLDEDEQAEFNATSQQKAVAPTETVSGSNLDSRTAEVQKTVLQVDTTAEQAAEAPEVDTNVDLIRDSARLFVRNLPYDATEADLEPVFAPFGKIEEVSAFSFPKCFSSVTLFHAYVSTRPLV